ncbi:CHASE3 domain-containing protein [Paenibacillus harenae]|uniref:CHASE3 domain-containing protein n=1 Tax=Paenibacillus harenae TaxID=306543 RepID=UPI002790FC71|nr:CHASE3 domain-containing protein [Paenibacillus harenae]MDQ0060365.1 two-component system chemotaxis sensor kinase CheA [Paenibacillus harenae]
MMLQAIRFPIRLKIVIGYFLIVLCLGVSIVIVTDRISSLQRDIETITSHDIEVHNLINQIENDIISMETAQRGFIITGNESYLEPYNDSRTTWEANYNSLTQLIADNPSVQKDLEGIGISIQHWIDTSGEPLIALKRAGDEDGILAFFRNDIGKQDIDQLRIHFDSLRDAEIETTKTYIMEMDNRNELLAIGLYAMLVVVAAIAFLIVYMISGSIVKTIKQVSQTITEIASVGGDLTTRIKVKTRDEISELADATNSLLTSLDMQNWIQKMVAEVATMTQGINDMQSLAGSFMTKVAPMVNAAYGAFYVRQGTGDRQRLVKISSYAAYGEDRSIGSFRIGEGLVGQCAQENRTFLLNHPADYGAKIVSGLTRTAPQSVLLVPVEYEGKVEAVIEFASLEPFTSLHLKLLEQIENHFGVSVNNVAGRMEVEKLLLESQSLTEELQTQTEELQAQSEELQMQQEEMRMTTEHLEEQNLFAEQKTKELELAKKELEAYADKLRISSQYKSNFLANMSHELRTPLNSILILSQMLSENDNKTLTAEEEGYARVIHTSGNDLLALIDDILDLSKIEAGKITLTIDKVNVTEIPELMRLSFGPVAEKKGLPFSASIEADVSPVLHTDGQRLQQILKNLLSNAFKFTDRGSVALRIRNADNKEIGELLPEYRHAEALAISVTDTGIGIPSDKQQLIFEAFQQVDGKTNRQYGGTGLGLSISSEFARLLGGRIVLHSVPDQGSVFTLYLPNLQQAETGKEVLTAYEEVAVSLTEESTLPVAVTEEGDCLAGKRVLLVEDDARNVYALGKALERKRLSVTVAGNGKQCLELLENETGFDLILMDIMMPVMDGFETMKAIREHPVMKDTPIIALTAKAMRSDRDKCLAAGASDYISKPIQMDQLYSLMRVWLTRQVGL